MQCNVNRAAGLILLSDRYRPLLVLDFQPFAACRVGLVKLPVRQFYIQRLLTILYQALLLCCDFQQQSSKCSGTFVSEAVITLSRLGGLLFAECRLRNGILRGKHNRIKSLIWIRQWTFLISVGWYFFKV